MQGHANIIWFLFSFHDGMGAHTDTHSCKGFIFVSDQSMFIRLNKKNEHNLIQCVSRKGYQFLTTYYIQCYLIL